MLKFFCNKKWTGSGDQVDAGKEKAGLSGVSGGTYGS